MLHQTSKDPDALACRYILRCAAEAAQHVTQAEDGHAEVEVWLSQAGFAASMEEIEFCEVPEAALVQRFHPVAEALVAAGACLRHHREGHPRARIQLHCGEEELVWESNGEVSTEDGQETAVAVGAGLAVRFPLHPAALAVIEEVLERLVPHGESLPGLQGSRAGGEESRLPIDPPALRKALASVEETIMERGRGLGEEEGAGPEGLAILWWLLEDWWLLHRHLPGDRLDGPAVFPHTIALSSQGWAVLRAALVVVDRVDKKPKPAEGAAVQGVDTGGVVAVRAAARVL